MKKKIISLLSVCGGLILTSVAFGTASSVHAEGWSNFNLQDVSFGDTVDIPSLTYTENGKTYDSSVVVTFPDGTEQMSNSVSFDQAGQYVATFSVSVEGKVYCREEKFFIDYPQYYVGNPSKSSVRYIDSAHLDEINSRTPGAYVNLAYGDTLYFSRPFELSELNASNALLKCFVVPSTYLSTDFTIMTFTLSSVDDPSNFVKIRYISHVETNSNGSVSHSSSVQARSDANSVFAGMHQSQGLRTNDQYGMWSGCTFDGYVQPSYNNTSYDTCQMVIGFDNETKNAYGTGFGLGKTLDRVLDLDNPNEVEKTWSGFTSDRVNLSITCDSYTGTTAGFVITSLLGAEVSDTKNELRDNVYVDEEAPVISLDDKYKTLPNGALGYHYPIPSASAYDAICLNVPVTAEVYYNYFDKNAMTKVKITDGYFDLERAGTYTILYTAKDYSGNTSTLAKSINVLNEISKPSFTLPAHEETMEVGSYVTIDKDIEITGGSGESTLKVYYSASDGEKKEVAGEGFRLEKLEDYTVYYEATDIIGQTTSLQYKIHVTEMTSPILEGAVTLPKYLMSGGYYEVPSSNAYTYENGALVAHPVSAEVTDAAGTKAYEAGSEYTAQAENNGDSAVVKLKYGDTVLQSDTVPVVKSLGKDNKPTALNLSNYFVSDGCAKTLRPNTDMFPGDEVKGMYLSADSDADFGFDFANFLLGNNFSVTVSQIKSVKAGTTIKFILTDYYDSSVSVTASLVFDGYDTYLEVNGKRTKILDYNMNSDDSFYMAFDGSSFTCCYDTSMAVTKDDNGKDFAGFSSYKANFRMEVIGGTSATNMVVNDICGYIFSSTTARDRTSPIIYSPSEMGGTKKIGDTYVTSPSYSCDVLSPNISFGLTIKGSDDQPVKDVNGLAIENVDPTKSYELVLDKYDVFTIELTSKEDSRFLTSPNTYTTSRYLHVYDDVKPTIKMQETFPDEVKVGTTVRFPKFTYSDNITSNDDLILQRIYLDPKGAYNYMGASETSITFSYVGTYKIMINVMDDAGNIANVTMYVNVTK